MEGRGVEVMEAMEELFMEERDWVTSGGEALVSLEV